MYIIKSSCLILYTKRNWLHLIHQHKKMETADFLSLTKISNLSLTWVRYLPNGAKTKTVGFCEKSLQIYYLITWRNNYDKHHMHGEKRKSLYLKWKQIKFNVAIWQALSFRFHRGCKNFQAHCHGHMGCDTLVQVARDSVKVYYHF